MNGTVKWIMGIFAAFFIAAAIAFFANAQAVSRDHEVRLAKIETRLAVSDERYERIEKQLDRIETLLLVTIPKPIQSTPTK